jgi:hypothetical protein
MMLQARSGERSARDLLREADERVAHIGQVGKEL